MRIARYRDANGAAQYGIVDGDTLFAASGDPIGGLRKGAEVGPVADAALLAPVTPGKIVCVGLNYAAHVTERDPNRKNPDEPVIFAKPTTAIINPGDVIEIANLEHATEYEAELVIVIGKTARDVVEADAMGYILGFTCGNDVSDRVLQKKDGQWLRAKGYDTYCPLGPWIETELDLTAAQVTSRLNGETKQNSTTADMIFKVPFLVQFISHVMTLHPGDIIMTGTPFGVAPMKPGDVIEVEVGGLGILTNRVGARAH